MTATKDQAFIQDLLSSAGITVGGTKAYDIQVRNDAFYTRVLREGALGLGEAYMDAWWDCEAVDQFIDRVLRAHVDQKIKRSIGLLWYAARARIFNLQRPARAFQVGQHHYDLDNDLYRAMLDKRLNYTCGYWRTATTLDQAQEAKLELICRKIGLKPEMTVLELGCGFGAFAGYAAEKYGARVLGLTVSKRQVELGMEMYRNLPVELRLEDYRKARGSYDRVISIGIMEHVGHKNHRKYMEVVDRTLKAGGIAFVHTIGNNTETLATNPWTSKYIFPNSMIPSIAQLSKAMEGLFVIEDVHNIGPDYDKTLMAWHENFERAWPELKKRYDERFYRMWRFYLLSSAGGFRARSNQLWQIVMTRESTPQPNCRIT